MVYVIMYLSILFHMFYPFNFDDHLRNYSTDFESNIQWPLRYNCCCLQGSRYAFCELSRSSIWLFVLLNIETIVSKRSSNHQPVLNHLNHAMNLLFTIHCNPIMRTDSLFVTFSCWLYVAHLFVLSTPFPFFTASCTYLAVYAVLLSPCVKH